MAPFIVTQNRNPEALKKNLLGDTSGLSNFNFTLIGDSRAFGTFGDDPFKLTSGIVLSTGRVIDLVGINQIDGSLAAPNQTPANSDALSTDFGAEGASDDSITLRIDFDAGNTKDKLYFRYVFGSEEFLEYAGQFNDSFSLKLNGQNLAKLPNGAEVNINNLAKTPFGPYDKSFIYNSASEGAGRDQTRLDGYSIPVLFEGDLIKNGHNTLIINIQDVNDGIFDSAVLIKGGSLGTQLPSDIPPDIPPDGSTPPSANPIPGNDNILTVSGASAQISNLLFTLKGIDATFINEVGLFKVNDDQGGLDLDNDGQTDLFPGDRDYTQSILEQGKVIFSALPRDGIPNATRILDFKGGDRLAFYLVQNSSTDEVLRGIASPSKVLFGSSFAKAAQQLQIEPASPNAAPTLKWEDGTNGGDRDFNDLVLTVQSTDQIPPSAGLQGNPQGELLDLRGVDLNRDGQADSIIQASFSVNREAANDNFAGLYRVDNTNGLIDHLLPGDPGYAAAAIQRSAVSFSRQGLDSVQLSGDQLGLLAPYLISKGTPEQFLKQNPDNLSGGSPTAYFNYLGANPDKADHIRLLGDNAFGFEDSHFRPDSDFNDTVVQARLLPAATY